MILFQGNSWRFYTESKIYKHVPKVT